MATGRRGSRRDSEGSPGSILGSLAVSQVRPRAAELGLRALHWYAGLQRLGIAMPFVVSHDIGLLLAAPRNQLELGPRVDPEALSGGSSKKAAALQGYAGLIDEIARSQVSEAAADLGLSDELVVVLLSRLLARPDSTLQRAKAPPELPRAESSLFERIEPQLLERWHEQKRSPEWRALSSVVADRLFLLTLVDALDIDTLRLFGLLGGDAALGSLAEVDLLAVLDSPEAHDVVNFSLEILPGVLEAKHKTGAGRVAAFGYSGLARKGSVDSLVLTELAWDSAEFMRRLADDELLYYAREQSDDELSRVHHLLIDASASMRGERTTFARGIALATAKKLLLAGDDVTLRFFDSRLYESQAAVRGRLPIGHLLSFKGERGRNPARVFQDFSTVLELAARRDKRQPIVHLFTHAALHIPRDTVAQLTRLAQVSGVFMLPSGGALELDYIDLLDSHWVIDHAHLAQGSRRTEAAQSILQKVSPGKPASSRSPARRSTRISENPR